MAQKFDLKKALGIILAAVVILGATFIPGSEKLTHEGIMALAVLIGAVLMWVLDSLPAGVTGIFSLVLLVLLGVSKMNTVFSGFGSNIIFFAISVFCLTVIMTKSKLSLRLTGALLSWAKADSEKLVLAFMMGATLLSTVMGNISVTVIFMGFAYTIFKAVNAKPGQSNLGKCLMIAIPIAAVNGGFGTPAGSSFNLVAMGLYEQATGTAITFLQWTIVGFPLAFVMSAICWFSIVKILKPEKIQESDLAELREKTSNVGAFDAYEKKTLFFMVLLPVLWILGSFPAFAFLNTTAVSVIGWTIMFMPGVNMMTWDEFQKGVPWNIILMLGSILSIGGVVASTGGAAYLANLFMNSGVMTMGAIMVLFLVSAFAYLLHTFFPVGPAILSLFLAPLIGVCAAAGISAAVPTIILALIVAGNYLLPINPMLMLTYNDGYYSTGDMFKSGIGPTILFLIITVLWVPFICGLIGL